MKPKTKKQYQDEIAKLSRRELYALLEGGGATAYSETTAIADKYGQASQITMTYDAEDNALLGTQEIAWTYYASGEVDTIAVIERDAAGKETSRRVIKHFADGRQPVLQQLA